MSEFVNAQGRANADFTHFLCDVQPEMRLWRKGLTGIPSMYLQGQERFARQDLERLKALGWNSYDVQLVSDGWCDGIRFISAIVESSHTGEIFRVKWSDCGKWYRKSESGGWILL